MAKRARTVLSETSPAPANLAGPFAVARELRATIERDGDPAPRFLYSAFEEFNATYFEGKLPPATIFFMSPSSPRALGDHTQVDEHGIRYRVRIAPACVRKGELFLRDVLLHELVHVAQTHLDGDAEHGYRGHGPKFASRCNAISVLLGLADVAAKGARKGLPDCAQWPLCVRPVGYYGVEIEKPRRAAEPDDAGDTATEGDAAAPSRRSGTRTVRALEEAMRSALALLEGDDVASATELLRAALGESD